MIEKIAGDLFDCLRLAETCLGIGSGGIRREGPFSGISAELIQRNRPAGTHIGQPNLRVIAGFQPEKYTQ